MFYKKIILIIIFALFSKISILEAQNRELPAQFYTSKTPFLTKIITTKDLKVKVTISRDNAIVPAKGTIFFDNSQELIKSNDSVFVLLTRTGIVYLLDPIADTSQSYSFHRLDRTININYNIGANNFLYNNHLYNYGGYGFWRLNGHIRSFNFLDKEWDIVPANYEIISNGFNWVSHKEGRIYVPFQSIMNGSIKGLKNEINSRLYDSYYFDLNLQEWKKIGSLSNKAKKLVVDNDLTNAFLNTEKGFLYTHNEDAFYFDFVNNKIYKSKNAELNQFLMRRASIDNMYFFNDTIYSYIPSTQKIDTKKLSMTDFEALDFPIWGIDNNYYYVLMAVLIFAVLIYIAILIYRKVIRKKVEQSNLKILKTKTIGQTFVGVELSLIQLLLEATTKGLNVEIADINHVLGIKDKNLGLQKKVRSDVINTINEKYAILINTETQLISSVRKDEDKRFYEYFINEQEVKSIKKILEKK
jgi:hypothetical protein